MELHAHTHTAGVPDGHRGRKKWTHYFWEFFMLFLAVFCGFLAENEREHFVEHKREKQYMVSLVADLQTDTAELKNALLQSDSCALYTDSVLQFLHSFTPANEIPIRLSDLINVAGRRLTLIHTDRTTSQLKYSGAMRLVRNNKVADTILKYWKLIDETNITLERYLIYRNSARELSLKLYVVPLVYIRGAQIPQDSVTRLKVIDPDPKKWLELANLNAVCGLILRGSHLRNLRKQTEIASHLIALIKKDYHLK